MTDRRRTEVRGDPRRARGLGGARRRLREQRTRGAQLPAADDRRGHPRRGRPRRSADARAHCRRHGVSPGRPGELARAVPLDGALHPDGGQPRAARAPQPGHRRQGRVPPLQGRADGARRGSRALVRLPQRAAAHVHGRLARRAQPPRRPETGVGGARGRGGARRRSARRRDRGGDQTGGCRSRWRATARWRRRTPAPSAPGDRRWPHPARPRDAGGVRRVPARAARGPDPAGRSERPR